MQTPLRIAGLIEHAARWHGTTEIVSRLPEGGPLHRYTYADAHQRAKQLAHALTRLGITVTERVPLLVNRNAHNNSYLNTKQAKLGHMMAPLTSLEQGEPVAPATPASVA